MVNKKSQKSWSGETNTFIVHGLNDPYFRLKKKMVIMTLLPNMLPPLEQWPKLLDKLIDRGYNAFHFSPLQEPGTSRSVYSISDHHRFGVRDPGKMVRMIAGYQKRGIHFFNDVVLNHINCDSKVLQRPENSEFFYSLKNTKYLAPILELDLFLLAVAPVIVNKFFGGNAEAKFDSVGQIDQIMGFLEPKIVDLKLYEFYMLDLAVIGDKYSNYTDFEDFEQKDNLEVKETLEIVLDGQESVHQFQKRYLTNVGHSRYSVLPNSAFLKKFHVDDYTPILKSYNKAVRSAFDKTTLPSILKNLRNFLFHDKYEKNLTVRAPQNSKEIQVFPKYFKKVINSATRNHQDSTYALLNGWLFEGHNLNILKHQGYSFLTREIIIWEDSVKLNYQDLETKPRLRRYMRTYLELMESFSDGFRVDNLHNSHPNIVQFMLSTLSDLARKRPDNKQVMILGELFTGDHHKEIVFCNKLGIHYLTRELIHFNGRDTPLPYMEDDGQIQVYFVQTHDNETYTLHGKVQLVLPHTSHSIASPAHVLTGSTLLGDELWPEKVHTFDWDSKFDMSVFDIKDGFRLQEALIGMDLHEGGQDGWVQPQLVGYLYDRVVWYRKEGVEDTIGVKGSWDSWGHETRLENISERHCWGVVSTAPGDVSFKFLVDDEWRCSQNYLERPEMNTGDDFNNHLMKISKIGLDPRIRVWHPSQGISLVRRYISRFKDAFQRKRLVGGTEDSTTMVLDWNTHLYQTMVYKKGSRGGDGPTDPDLELFQILVKNGDSGKLHSIPILGKLVHFEVITMLDSRPRPCYLADTQISRYAFTDQKRLYLVNLPLICTVLIRSEEHCTEFKSLETLHLKYIQPNPCFNQPLDLGELNYLLYSCSAEEKHQQDGEDTYSVPGYKKFIYAGMSSLLKALDNKKARAAIKLHMNEGDWLIEYYFKRFFRVFGERSPELINLKLALVKNTPLPVRFEFFGKTIQYIYTYLAKGFLTPIGLSQEQYRCRLLKALLMCVPQFFSEGKMSAGLPRYCFGPEKEWGRDTFISLPGLLLATKRFREAREIFLDYAKAIRDGIIPTVKRKMDYSAMDNTWWYFYALGRYLDLSGDYSILKESIRVKTGKHRGKELPLLEVLIEALDAHIEGRNGLDSSLDIGSGLEIVKGNKDRVLTWMNRKGTGSLNKGVISNPRVGAPVEITALRWYAFRLMGRLCEKMRKSWKDYKANIDFYRTIVSKNLNFSIEDQKNLICL